MIVVVGEALIDLVVSPGGQVAARPGGSPFNAARSLARLGAETTFLARLASDGLGRLLRDRLTADGVAIGVPEESGRPSTLAVATLDQAGSASYAFYLDGTAGADLDYEALKKGLPADATGVPAVVDGVAGLVDRGGRLLVFGVTPAEATLSLSPFRVYNDEITVTGSMAILRSFAPAVELIASGAIDPRPLLSEPLPLAEFGEALHRVRTGQGIKWHIRP